MNQYVEEVLVESLRPPSAGSIDALVEDIKLSSGIPQSILNMSRICLPDDAELDDRCIYILGK